ncbi:MAG: hypothetical protein D3926_20135 [Desulfobacteraceae bacterium]|nr:MAG: hypothetical protein D3926_20135 [Desulfobacteraceae bacterium]
MMEQPEKSMNIHFKFKLLAITAIAFLLYVVLTAPQEFSNFSETVQFKLIGPWMILFGIWYLMLRKRQMPCPYCQKAVAMKTKWQCPECQYIHAQDRFIFDKCLQCKTIQSKSSCEHCNKEFGL